MGHQRLCESLVGTKGGGGHRVNRSWAKIHFQFLTAEAMSIPPKKRAVGLVFAPFDFVAMPGIGPLPHPFWLGGDSICSATLPAQRHAAFVRAAQHPVRTAVQNSATVAAG